MNLSSASALLPGYLLRYRCQSSTVFSHQLREDHPDLVADLPSYTTFTRRVKSDIPEAVEVLGRHKGVGHLDPQALEYRGRLEPLLPVLGLPFAVSPLPTV